MTLTLTLGKRIAFFACITLFCYMLMALLLQLVLGHTGQQTVWLRIMAVAQDLIMFILPAIVTALFCTRLPAQFLAINSGIPRGMTIIAVCTLICSIPAMNALIMWNESIHLPGNLEATFRAAEEAAQAQVTLLLGPNTIMNFIVSLLIVGVLAGLSEELFFRGAFQRLLTTGRWNVHTAVWLVAFIFSAVHMQFYGFFPRMLLGAFFGYALVWSGSLWLPVILHVLNNSVYIFGRYFLGDDMANASAVDTIGADSIPLIVISVVLTALGLTILYRRRVRPDAEN